MAFTETLQHPKLVCIETASTCTAKCIICPYEENWKAKIEHGMMSTEMFKKIVDECDANGVEEMFLCGNNDPLLDPRIVEMLEYAGKTNCKIILSSNMSFINDKIIDAIIANADHFIMSFHCHNFKDHSLVMGVDTENAMKNIEKFREKYSKASKSARPKIVINNHVCDSIVDRLKLEAYWRRKGFHPEFDVFASRASALYDIKPGEVKFCGQGDQPFTTMVISWNGELYPCCNDWSRKVSYGNVSEGVMKVWHGEKMNELRDMINGKANVPDDFLCRKCEYARERKGTTIEWFKRKKLLKQRGWTKEQELRTMQINAEKLRQKGLVVPEASMSKDGVIQVHKHIEDHHVAAPAQLSQNVSEPTPFGVHTHNGKINIIQDDKKVNGHSSDDCGSGNCGCGSGGCH